MTVASPETSDTISSREPIRVMIVDDSAVVRGIIGNWFAGDPGFAVVASHFNGRRAVDDVTNSKPDVIILDLEMPEMGGLDALPLILERKPGTAVIVASTLSQRGAEASITALNLGAADYLPKPSAATNKINSAEFRADLLQKVRELGLKARRRIERTAAPRPAPAVTAGAAAAAPAPAPVAKLAPQPIAKPRMPEALRRPSTAPVRAIVIGSSTGGPQALSKVFTALGPAMAGVPVLVTQHMPPTFTTILAEHLSRSAGRDAREGTDGEVVVPGRIYVAPGARHMLITRSGQDVVIRLSDAPPVNYCKPAVDPLFQSAAAVYGANLLGVVLTGMGTDGAKGGQAIVAAGGTMIAQDEETSVVWGMPGAMAATGVCSGVLPIDEIGPKLAGFLGGRR